MRSDPGIGALAAFSVGVDEKCGVDEAVGVEHLFRDDLGEVVASHAAVNGIAQVDLT